MVNSVKAIAYAAEVFLTICDVSATGEVLTVQAVCW